MLNVLYYKGIDCQSGIDKNGFEVQSTEKYIKLKEVDFLNKCDKIFKKPF